jgi:hypothetical protein
MRLARRTPQVMTWIAALGGPAVLTALLAQVSTSQKRDYIFLYLGLVAVLGVLRRCCASRLLSTTSRPPEP